MSRQVDVKALISHIVKGDGLDKCRICMGETSEGHVHLTDTVMMDGDKAVTLSELLELISGIEVDDGASLPQILCSDCAEQAHSFAKFKSLTEKSAQFWKTAVTFLSQMDYEDAKPLVYKHSEQTIILQKKVQSLKFDGTGLVQQNKTMKHNFYCPFCYKKYKSAENLNKHLKMMSKVFCECGMMMEKSDICKHLQDKHRLNVFECRNCHEMFSSQELVKRHKTYKHGPKFANCRYCGHGFGTLRALRAHAISHKLFDCSCGKTFESNNCYSYHKTICNTIHKLEFSVYECNDCGSQYTKKASLKIHISQKHLNVLPYVCQICGKRTSSLNHLNSHSKVHEEYRKTIHCHCGAKFQSKIGYNLHMRVHSGYRPYKCEECGEAFISSSRRSDHVKRRHKGFEGMNYVCELCPVRFIRPWELKKHYKLTHDSIVDVQRVPRQKRLIVNPNILSESIQEELDCPGGVCVACASAALAAEEFRLFLLSAESLWRRAVKNLSHLPHGDNARSLCALVSPNATVDIHSDFDGGDPTTVLNRVKTKLFKRHARKPRTLRNGPNVCCPDCHKVFTSPHLLQTHLQNSDRKTACGDCGSIVTKGEGLQQHLITAHKRTAILCKECPTVVLSEKELKLHESSAHKQGALNCGACGRTFTRKVSYDSHIQMHIIWTCRSCETQFSNRSCYRQHRSTCEPNAKPQPKTTSRVKRSNNRDPGQYICDYCQKMYTSRPQLKNHILWIHLDHRPHQCSYCGKRFYTSARLNEHSVVHTRIRKFECDLCDAKLVSKSAAIYHRRRHTGEKPYICDDCGAAFISSSRRLEHAKRIHNKGVRFKCPECPSSFVRRKEVEKHVEKHHSDVPKYKFICDTVVTRQ